MNSSTQSKVPQRTPYPSDRGNKSQRGIFALHFARIVVERGVARDYGTTAALLLFVIASKEDELFYRGPVTFWNEQLMGLIGAGSRETLRAARTRLVDAGWLHYEPGGKGKPGRYWVLIPGGEDAPGSNYPAQNLGAKNDDAEFTCPESSQKPGRKDDYPAQKLDTNRAPFNPIPHNPNTYSSRCNEKDESQAPANGKARKKPATKRKPKPKAKHEPVDVELANHMADRVLALQPARRELKPARRGATLDRWATDVRLMRERDERSPDDIRQVFDWANADPFWKANILSARKLREKFDDLKLRMEGTHNGKSSRRRTNTGAGVVYHGADAPALDKEGVI